MTTSETKLRMKLLVDTKAKRVLFAEADKSCVDFLFHILSLPVATVIRLIKEKGMSYGCLPELYDSVENLDDTYIQSKDLLLKPKSSVTGISSIPFLSISDVPATQKTIYGCSNSNIYSQCRSCYSDSSNARCTHCRNSMSRMLTYVAPPGASEAVAAPKGFVKDVVTYVVMDNMVVKPMSTISSITLLNRAAPKGFVKDVVTYMVMDNLVVKPMSTISSITLLNKFNVKDVGFLQEVEVNFGMEEALKLLKASFESKTVLTSVFMSI